MGPAFQDTMALEMGPAFCARWAALRSQRASRFYACGCFASRLADTYALCLGCLANHQQTGELVMIWRWLKGSLGGMDRTKREGESRREVEKEVEKEYALRGHPHTAGVLCSNLRRRR